MRLAIVVALSLIICNINVDSSVIDVADESESVSFKTFSFSTFLSFFD